MEAIAELDTIVVGAEVPRRTLVVLLHGYAMTADDLAPFGRSLGIPALFLFPQGPLAAVPGGRAWWPIDAAARAARQVGGPRDLTDVVPRGLAVAREQLARYIASCRERYRPERLVVGGFSQGGMLACDWLLHCAPPLDALLLMSASRVNAAAWRVQRSRIGNLPVFVSHGRADADLSFAAGEQLRDFALDAGARVTWTPFDGGHELPLTVWRSVRKFLRPIVV
jgi:phospholipase/carboxylesterase